MLIEHLRHARALIILDNCEHVLPGCHEVISATLQACPDLHILATSRHYLGVEGENIRVVSPLPLPPDSEMLTESPGAYPSVQLFEDRASAVMPGFTANKDNIATVAAVCRKTEGIPLAIELAAVRLRTLSITQLLDGMDDRFRLLSKGYTTAPKRQRSLQTLIDWSYELCSDAERSLWQRSSVFADGFDLEAAHAVCADDDMSRMDMADLIEGLIDKSLLQKESHHGHTRYRMLETLRDYGRERLAPASLAQLQERHRIWCRDLVAQAAEKFFSADQLEWGQRLMLEHANLRTALASCLSDSEAGTVGLGIAAELRFYWFTSALLAEGRRWLRPLLQLAPSPTPARVAALEVAGYLAILQGEPTDGNRLLDEGRETAVELDDCAGLSKIAYAQGLAKMLMGRSREATFLFHECLEILRAENQPPSAIEALTCFHLTVLSCVDGDTQEATAWCDRGIQSSENAGEIWCRAFGLWARGIIACCRGEREEAIRNECHSLDLNQVVGDKVHGAHAIEALAWVASAEGSHERAAMLLGGLETAWKDLGTSLFSHVSTWHDKCERESRHALGPAVYERVFRKGTEIPFNGLVELAFQADAERSSETTPASLPATDQVLTRREQEVASLITQGMGNREIASALVISERTAETHVSHILAKLNCTRRSEIVVWTQRQ
ncbi:LuxR C-terminal-related transcriptional regulator [Streptomyces sp. NBC_01619]|uniref:ATP-binding protein n=1 Tax=Streptomyces sp. NBC_01619 TaxID=2975901 RepID=UPI002B1CBFA1|nr:LuxR C-terminal-related transcriptional regulator [Streptomyces sp. NBC_01619]